MVDLILLGILLIGFLIGFRRGFVLQIVHIIGFIVAFIVAYLYFDDLSVHLNLWIPYPEIGVDQSFSSFFDSVNLESAYYRGISFALLFFSTKIVMQIIGSMLDFLADLPLLHSMNGILGGILGFIEAYFIIFFILYVGALIPMEFIQQMMDQSIISKVIVEHTPLFSSKIKELWFEQVAPLLQ